MEPTERTLDQISDDELFDLLKHLAAMWFKNTDILILEELFRRYNKIKAKQNGT